MQNLIVSFFFLINTAEDIQGLIDSSITSCFLLLNNFINFLPHINKNSMKNLFDGERIFYINYMFSNLTQFLQ